MRARLEKLKADAAANSVAHEIARLKDQRASWRQALAQTDSIAQQLQELIQVDSAYAQFAEELKTLQNPALSIAAQYKDLLGANSLALQKVRQWHEAQCAEHESIRKMIEPIGDIRKSLMLDDSTQRMIKQFAGIGSVNDQLKDLIEQTSAIGSVATMWTQQIEDSRAQTKRLFADFGVGSSVHSYLRDFEQINKRWNVPSEILGLLGSFEEIREQMGKVALPTIDWGSAGALAMILGKEGLQQQLGYLGIGPDGSLHEPTETPEKGILSREQSDVVALLSLLLSILFFIYQETSSTLDTTKTEAFHAQTAVTLQAQAQTIQSLTVLIEKALVEAAKVPDDHYVVRVRPAAVRSTPEHGAPVEGKLLPNEVVRTIEKEGKWIKVEYYHWLHEEYRTGWVLKKYLERVPANHSKAGST